LNIPNQHIDVPLLREKGVTLHIKREDTIHPQISGNKYRKLKYNLLEAQKLGHETLLTFDQPSGWLQQFWEKSPRNFRVRYGAPKPTITGDYPSTLRISSANNWLELRFTRVTPNPVIPASHLRLDIPPGIPMEPMKHVEFLKG